MRHLAALVRRSYSSSARTFEEVHIPVPWGHLAGKWWGPRDTQPILAVHGWQENCNSFDPLIKTLPPGLSILAVDMPGNGLSPPYPDRSPYLLIEDVLAMRGLLKHFNFPKPVKFLLHSYSVGMGFTYASAYPEEVDRMLVIDFVKPMPTNPNHLVDKGGVLLDKVVQQAMKLDKPPKEMTREEHAAQYRKAVMNSISLESSSLLMERGTNLNPETGLYYINRDARIQTYFYYSFPNEFLMEMAKNIKCKLLLLRASKGLVFEGPKAIKMVQDEMQKAAKSMEIVDVEGTHHIHMDKPEIVAPFVLDFLISQQNEDNNEENEWIKIGNTQSMKG